MTKLEEIASLLGVEIGEEFQITNDVYTYRITEQAMERKIGGEWIGIAGAALYEVLRGKKHIIKMPWKPKTGEAYWCETYYGASEIIWGDRFFDFANYAVGNCFRTSEELKEHNREVRAQLQKIYDSGKPLIEVDKGRESECHA